MEQTDNGLYIYAGLKSLTDIIFGSFLVYLNNITGTLLMNVNINRRDLRDI